MDFYNYGSRGAPRILTSLGLMLASGFSALSRLLYGICEPRRGSGHARGDCDYTRRDNGNGQNWNRGGYTGPNGGNGQYWSRDNSYAYRDNGYSRPENSAGYSWNRGGYENPDSGAGCSWNRDNGYARRQENGWQQYAGWRDL